MSQEPDLDPPIDEADETEAVTFDFGPLMMEGESIASIIGVGLGTSCAVYSGVDADAATRKIGLPAIAVSPRTGVQQAAVIQKYGQMVGGVKYRLKCVVLTTTNQQLVLYTHLACRKVI